MKGFGNKSLKKNLNSRDFLKEKLKKEAFKYYKQGDLNSALKYCSSFIAKGYKMFNSSLNTGLYYLN